jgi:hypothetical protein
VSIVVYSRLSELTTTEMYDKEKLISLVLNYRSLYDKTDSFYDNSVRNNQWKQTAGLMNEPGV